MGLNTGLYEKAYLNTGSYATPTLTLISQIGDIKHIDSRNQGKVKLRAFQHELSVPGQRVVEVSFDLAKNPGNTVWEAIHDAYGATPPTPKEFFLFYSGDSATTDSEADRMHCEIAEFGADQNLEDLCVNAVKLVPSARLQGAETSIHEPVVYVVA